MVIINPKGDTAFNSHEFAYAYVTKWDLAPTTLLQIILKNETELWWDSTPGQCIYAEKDMTDSLAILVSQMTGVIISPDKRQALNVEEFNSARVSNCKETHATQLIVELKSVSDIRWIDRPYGDESETEMQKELSNFVAELNERKRYDSRT